MLKLEATTRLTSDARGMDREVDCEIERNPISQLYLKIGDLKRVVKTKDYHSFHDGFSFCVTTEIEAFQAAYHFQGSKRITVRPASKESGMGWLVSVYTNHPMPH